MRIGLNGDWEMSFDQIWEIVCGDQELDLGIFGVWQLLTRTKEIEC